MKSDVPLLCRKNASEGKSDFGLSDVNQLLNLIICLRALILNLFNFKSFLFVLIVFIIRGINFYLFDVCFKV